MGLCSLSGALQAAGAKGVGNPNSCTEITFVYFILKMLLVEQRSIQPQVEKVTLVKKKNQYLKMKVVLTEEYLTDIW